MFRDTYTLFGEIIPVRNTSINRRGNAFLKRFRMQKPVYFCSPFPMRYAVNRSIKSVKPIKNIYFCKTDLFIIHQWHPMTSMAPTQFSQTSAIILLWQHPQLRSQLFFKVLFKMYYIKLYTTLTYIFNKIQYFFII